MAVKQGRVLELALEKLMEEKHRIDGEIAEIRAQLQQHGSSSRNSQRGRKPGRPKTKGSAAKKKATKKKASRKAVSSKMRKLWKQAKAAGYTNLKDYNASLSKN